MLRYFTREESEFIKENGDLVHEHVRVIHSDGKNVIVEDDGETYTIPNQYIDDTINLFNYPYYNGPNLDKRLALDFNITTRDIHTPFSAFSKNPLEMGANQFFNTIFSNNCLYDDDIDCRETTLKKQNKKHNTKKNVRNSRTLITKLNKTRKIKN